MKKLFFLILMALTLTYSQAQLVQKESSASIVNLLELKQTSHDFGKIAQSKPVYTNFEILNTGKEPLVLQSVVASCGCTTPEWDHQPIAPGANSIIKVGYNAAAEGHFEKIITITYNGDKTQVLTIKGDVWKAPSGSAPANASIQLLKQTNQ